MLQWLGGGDIVHLHFPQQLHVISNCYVCCEIRAEVRDLWGLQMSNLEIIETAWADTI
jgi:hypothetical protein